MSERTRRQRVFGFELMPAPFVVAHLQVGLTMQDLDAPLADDGAERPGIFLTNALTGWEPRMTKPLPLPELEEERDRAERVKQETPILVILGNPPYNGFAGMAVDEERELSEAYRTTRRVRRPEGQGLNDLYVRFFRMAERRIAEKSGRGVVCFISNYSWLDGLSFTGMRERYLEAFDAIRIDCLNGDKYKTGKVAPDGTPDPSIFSTEGDPVGIQVWTAIATLVRKAEHAPAGEIGFRHLRGRGPIHRLRLSVSRSGHDGGATSIQRDRASLTRRLLSRGRLALPIACRVVIVLLQVRVFRVRPPLRWWVACARRHRDLPTSLGAGSRSGAVAGGIGVERGRWCSPVALCRRGPLS